MRFEARRLARSLLADDDGPNQKLVSCGLPTGAAVHVSADGIGGLAVCKSGLRCVWCQPRNLAEIRTDYSWFTTQAEFQLDQRLSIPHARTDPLKPALESVRTGWASIGNDYVIRKLRAELKLAPLTILHVTWSARNGWHPHLHVNWISPKPAPVEVIGRIDAAVRDAWGNGTGARQQQAVWTREEYTPPNWVKYTTKESRWHPSNDCRHPDHPGCRFCNKSIESDEFWQQAMPSQPEWDFGPQPDRELKPTPGWDFPSFNVFPGIAQPAIAGSKQARALLREYLTATARHRLAGDTRGAVRLFGRPPEQAKWVQPADGVKVDSSVWGLAVLSGANTSTLRKAVLAGDLGTVAELAGFPVTQKNGVIIPQHIASTKQMVYR